MFSGDEIYDDDITSDPANILGDEGDDLEAPEPPPAPRRQALTPAECGAAVAKAARCYRCGGREQLFALDAQHITTADATKVAMWCCSECFDSPGKPARLVKRGKRRSSPPAGGCRR